MTPSEHFSPWAEMDPDLENLFHPASAFDHPRDVANDPDLSLEEKRAILSSWASDACAVASAPALRQPAGAMRPVTFDEVVDALRSLDGNPPPPQGGKSRRRRSGPPWSDPGSNRGGAIRL
jgi:hypothetical protein